MNAKLAEVAAWIKANTKLEDPQQEFSDVNAYLDKVAVQFGGESIHTGGGIIVTLIPVEPVVIIAVGTESMGLYRDKDLKKTPYDIFWDNDSGGDVETVNFF